MDEIITTLMTLTNTGVGVCETGIILAKEGWNKLPVHFVYYLPGAIK